MGGVAAASGGRPAGDVRGTSGAGAPQGGTTAQSGTTAPAPALDESAELYDEDVLPRFDITLSDSSLAMLRADGERYVPGDLRYGDESVSNIGVRIKGSASRRTIDEKAAFKLKLDEYVADQSFRGLRRLTFNNMVEDPSFIAERLAYAVFRAAGLPAPRCNNALVYVNGEPYGVYANVESVDKTFLRRWFEDEDGNLYEVAGSDFVPGAEQSFELETNETQNDRSDLSALIAVVASPDGNASSFLDDIAAVLDVPRFLRFTAAEAAVNQWDMYAYTRFYPNNFRLYRDPGTQQFVFLPGGMDLSMKPFLETGRAHIAIHEPARERDQPDGPVTAGLLFQRCLASDACRAQYDQAVRELIAVYEGLDLEAMAQRYHAQIAVHALADPRTPYDAEQIEAGYEKVLATIRERPGAMRDELEP
jgi:spore coat protein CotH